MNTWTQEEMNAALQEIFEKAAIDEEFRKLAIEQPNEAIKQISGKEAPEGYRLKFVEPDPESDYTLVLPDFQGDELSDDELEGIAGGKAAERRVRWRAGVEISG